MISIHLTGPFCITDNNGAPLALRSSKAKAVLALLAFSPTLSRSRTWLQSKLWSDRAPEQASGSLRNALTCIRKSLNENKNAIVSDGNMVSLRADMIKFVHECSLDLGSEPLEGLEVRDAEFENWIRDVRTSWPKSLARNSRSPQSKAFAVLIKLSSGTTSFELLVKNGMSSVLSASLCEVFGKNSVYFLDGKLPEINADNILEIEISVSLAGGGVYANGRILNSSGGQVFWGLSDHFVNFEGCSEAHEGKIRKFCGLLVGKVSDTLRERTFFQDEHSTRLSLIERAKVTMFGFSQRDFEVAEGLFIKAAELGESGEILAWRALLRNLAKFQLQTSSFFEDPIQPYELVEQALAKSGSNSSALAIASQILYVSSDNPKAALKLATSATDFNPLNGLAWALKSNLETACGQNEVGYVSAQQALSVSPSAPWSGLAEFFACMSSAGGENYELALAHADAATLRTKCFAAPNRYRLAISRAIGDPRRERVSLEAISEIEPDFIISDLLAETYPVQTMKKMKLMDVLQRNLGN